MKRFLKEYLSYSRSERNGILVLGTILVLICCLNYALGWLIPPELPDRDALEKQAKAFSTGRNKHNAGSAGSVSTDSLTLFFFDPNTATESDWLKLGVPPRTGRTIRNYLARGGRFRSAEDLKKIYGFRQEDYERLIPYVRIAADVTPAALHPGRRHEKDTVFLDINLADSAALTGLKGIGPVFASRIVKYRNLLGGFHDPAQLLEVYGMDSARYNLVRPFLITGSPLHRKINLDTTGIDGLRKHPYIGTAAARAIVQYRSKKGEFITVEEALKAYAFGDEAFRKLFPYLSVSE